jgi:hypothetical protein
MYRPRRDRRGPVEGLHRPRAEASLSPRLSRLARPLCPWYVTAHAVERYMEIRRHQRREKGRALIPAVELSFKDASRELIEYAAATWQLYEGTDKTPTITRTGAYQYRGGRPLRLHLIVSMSVRPEGRKPQLVDVILPMRQR